MPLEIGLSENEDDTPNLYKSKRTMSFTLSVYFMYRFCML